MSRRRPSGSGSGPPPPQYTPPKVDEDKPHPQVTERVRPQKTKLKISAAAERDPIPFLFGTKQTSGGIRFARKVGRDLYIVRVLALGRRSATVRGGEAAGELDALVSLKTEDGRTAASLSSHFRFNWYNGTLTQGVDLLLKKAYPGWNETLVLTNPQTGEQRGLSYAVEQYRNYSGWWKENGGLPTWIYTLRGSRLLNPRTGITAYSENLFEQMRYWALDPDGLYMWLASLNAPAFAGAMDIADQVLGTGKLYRTHFLMEAGNTQDWLKMFRLLGDAFWFEDDAGKWTVLVDRPSAPVAVYSDLHYTSLRDIDGAPPKDVSQLINKVTIEHTDTSTTPWSTKSVSKSSDGLIAGVEDEQPATYKLLEIHDDAMIVSKLNYLLYGEQDDYRVQLNWRANTLDRSLGDVVTQTIPERGLAGDWRLMWRDKNSDATADVELQLMTARKYSDVGGPAGPAKVASTLPDRFEAPANVGAVYPSLRAGVFALSWQAVPGRAVGYEARAGGLADTFDTMSMVIYRGDAIGCSFKPNYGLHKVAVKAYTPTAYSAAAAEVVLTVEREGPTISEVSMPLQYLTGILQPSDIVRIGDYLIIEGVNTRQKFTVMLDNSKTGDALDAEMIEGGYAHVDAWEAAVPEAEYGGWGPLPDEGCTGEFLDSGSHNFGSAFRNERIKFRMAAPVRLGVNQTDVVAKVEPLLKNPTFGNPPLAGPTVEVGKGGWENRFGARLSTNNRYAQAIIVTAAAQPLWFYTAEKIPVRLEEPTLTTDAAGVATRNIAIPLGNWQEPEVTFTPKSATPVYVTLTAVDNDSFQIKVVDASNTPVAGCEVRCVVEDKGRGGSIGIVTV